MDALGLFWHLSNFLLPAAGVGAISALLFKLMWRRTLASVAWWTLAWQNAVAGAVVLLAGLLITGHDGRMLTYAGLCLACAVLPWWRTVSRRSASR